MAFTETLCPNIIAGIATARSVIATRWRWESDDIEDELTV
jgi:hypothetical protein